MKRLYKIALLSLSILFLPISIWSGQGKVSVQDMFKDVTEPELIQMMEEGQRFIQELQEKGSPEDKEAFEKAMEETLKSFTQEDWQEFQQIVETVQDKLPPVPEESQWKPQPVKRETKAQEKKQEKADVKKESADKTIEQMIVDINKKVKNIIQKTQSDKTLAEQFNHAWTAHDDFNEMIRQIMVLNKKDHIAKLTQAKDEETKFLVESLKNFHLRLKQEDSLFQIADTFGLEVDEKTSNLNKVKLQRVLDFFSTGITSLAPKVTEFIKKHEPEALENAKALDEKAQQAQKHAKDGQKIAPTGISGYSPTQAPYSAQNHSGVPRYPYSGRSYPRGYQPYRPAQRKQIGQPKNTEPKKSESTFEKQAQEDKNVKKQKIEPTAFEEVKNGIEGYLDAFTQDDVQKLHTTIDKAKTGYVDFATLATLTDDKKLQELHTYHLGLLADTKQLAPDFEDLHSALQNAQSRLPYLKDEEVDEIANLKAIKAIKDRFTSYKTKYDDFVSYTGSKFPTNLMLLRSQAAKDRYMELQKQIQQLHGIGGKIEATQVMIDTLDRYIRKEQRKRLRNRSKASQSTREHKA